MILVFKLLEIFQFVLISFYVSLFITDYYNDILYDYLYKFFKKDKNKITVHLFVILYLFILSTTFFFINKFLKYIPFIFKDYSKKYGYISSFKKENMIGVGLGITIIYLPKQVKFQKLITELYDGINWK